MNVRAKFQCTQVARDVAGADVSLAVVYDTNLQTENGRFTKATPSGKITMRVDNPDAAIQFVPGKYYYVDFSEAEGVGQALPQRF